MESCKHLLHMAVDIGNDGHADCPELFIFYWLVGGRMAEKWPWQCRASSCLPMMRWLARLQGCPAGACNCVRFFDDRTVCAAMGPSETRWACSPRVHGGRTWHPAPWLRCRPGWRVTSDSERGVSAGAWGRLATLREKGVFNPADVDKLGGRGVCAGARGRPPVTARRPSMRHRTHAPRPPSLSTSAGLNTPSRSVASRPHAPARTPVSGSAESHTPARSGRSVTGGSAQPPRSTAVAPVAEQASGIQIGAIAGDQTGPIIEEMNAIQARQGRTLQTGP